MEQDWVYGATTSRGQESGRNLNASRKMAEEISAEVTGSEKSTFERTARLRLATFELSFLGHWICNTAK